MAGPTELIRVENLTKRFGAVLANDRVSAAFRGGEIHGLLGENGAGKSTLVKILAGTLRPDEGRILVDGVEADIRDPARSRELGISVVHQQSPLVPTLTVLENIALQEVRLGLIPRSELARRASEIADRLNIKLDFDRRIEQMSVGNRLRAEMLRALLTGSRLLVMDEPTALLAPFEVADLFRLLRALADEGTCIVVVTHHVKEALKQCDRITVLRQGRVVGELAGGRSESELIRLMVGHVGRGAPKPRLRPGAEILRFREVAGIEDETGGELHRLSFCICAGEILGIAGIEGNGQAELAAASVGHWTPRAGEISLAGRPMSGYSSAERRRLIADIPDNSALAMAPEQSVWQGLSLTAMLWKVDPLPWVRPVLRQAAANLVNTFSVRTASLDSPVSALSGGNQQRAIVARELAKSPRLVVAAYATKGLDVRSAVFIRDAILALAEQGAAVLYISSDLEEILEVSDRIGVLAHGRMVAIVDAEGVSGNEIGTLMLGRDLGRFQCRSVECRCLMDSSQAS